MFYAQLEDDLTNKGAPPGLNGLVKGLIKNYKLDESLRQGVMYIESSGDRRTADSAGREALEYLAQTAEYFPPELDERYAKASNPVPSYSSGRIVRLAYPLLCSLAQPRGRFCWSFLGKSDKMEKVEK